MGLATVLDSMPRSADSVRAVFLDPDPTEWAVFLIQGPMEWAAVSEGEFP